MRDVLLFLCPIILSLEKSFRATPDHHLCVPAAGLAVRVMDVCSVGVQSLV